MSEQRRDRRRLHRAAESYARAYSEAAAQAGIHVLCEKPMAFDETECEAMIAAAEKGHVKLMIAYRLHFERGNLDSIETIKSGKIGDPRYFTSSFSQQVKADNSRLKAEVGGGPYMTWVFIASMLPATCSARARRSLRMESQLEDKRFLEVPEMTSGLMKFPDNRIASFTCSFGAADRSVYEVVGTKGVLKMDPAYEMAEALKSETHLQRGRNLEKGQVAPELVYFRTAS